MVAALILSGCQAQPLRPAPRWTLVQANETAVWRMDTATGALQYCFMLLTVQCHDPVAVSPAKAVDEWTPDRPRGSSPSN